MSPTRSQVESWRTSALAEWADRIAAENEGYLAQLEQSRKHFRDIDSEWAGAAYDAAYDRVGQEHDEGRKLYYEVAEFVTALREGADRLSREASVLLGKVAEAEAERPLGATLSVSDGWAVSLTRPEQTTEEQAATMMARAFAHHEAIANAFWSLRTAIGEVAQSITRNNDEIRTRGGQLSAGLLAEGPEGWSTQRDLTGELGSQDGALLADGTATDADMRTIAQRLAEAGLTPQDIADINAGKKVELTEGQWEYLHSFYNSAGKDGLLWMTDRLNANGDTTQAASVVNQLNTLANPNVTANLTQPNGTPLPVQGGLGQLPQDLSNVLTRDYTERRNPMGGGSNIDARELDQVTRMLALGDANSAPGSEINKQLLIKAAELDEAAHNRANIAEDYRLGTTGDLMQRMVEVGGDDKGAVHSILSGQGLPEGTTTEDVLDPLMTRRWKDDGAAVENMLSWIEGDATSPDHAVSERAGQAAAGLSKYVAENSDQLLNLTGDRTPSIGEENPRIVNGISSALSPYIAELAGVDNPFTNGFTRPGGIDDESLQASQKIFAVIDTNSDAAQEFNAKALQVSGDLQGAWVDSVLNDPKNPDHDLAAKSGMLRALVDRGLEIEAADRTKDGAGAATKAFADTGAAYDSFKTALTNGIKYVPVVGPLAGIPIDMGNTYAKNSMIGWYLPPDAATPQINLDNRYEPPRQYYQIAQVLEERNGPIPHDPRYGYMFDSNGRLKDYEKIVAEGNQDEVRVDSNLTNILNNYQNGTLVNAWQDFKIKFSEGRDQVK